MKYFSYIMYAAIVLIAASFNCQAQERPIYTQYMFNETAFNPAYTGSPERLSITGLYRKQWVGIDGAPTTQTVSIHSPINKQSMALGLQVLNDVIGVSSRAEAKSMFAYRIRFNETSKLSFGIQAGIRWYDEDFSMLYDELMDSDFSESIKSSKFLFGTGVYYHTERFYVGASAPAIHTKFSAKNHIFITSGYVMDIGSQLKLKPNFLLKLADNAPVSYDLNANLLIQEMIWFGVSYRSRESIGLLTQLQLTEKLAFGYSFDLPVGGISPYGQGSHELSLNYTLQLPTIAYKCPRYF
ncbi:type IX secretion system membrane protein PorP/SprF [Porifericola rhodea]|uniref:PorP/SprF family type IX secretion system membrane protein n=1 Tax=Porifericola rhodea TaxID=930972 RepID=UPI002666E393|nr:type IX secretion system membrane protein PorP/SprF [Porifericola rhodea]WKN30841.1 type IX secretion system membrane protein PorP/SprF [Porifericola rhodea]